ncbi:serine protease [Culex quinquefasciatus]|uniref:Serine protease n=1 Tax=Culex quinquefasciatus TaxID=7176 RepID=B0WTZ7_CULQU|nr:serine protease [Culex quinquefasciatus]|eukprot:XP_001870895.1 serine protease [Culex quinquefasciatus]
MTWKQQRRRAALISQQIAGSKRKVFGSGFVLVAAVILVHSLEGVGVEAQQRTHSAQQEQDILILDALGKRQSFSGNNVDYGPNSIMDLLGRMIPQTCRHKGRKFECGLSISCVLGGGKPVDLCSGGMIWSCCIDREPQVEHDPEQGAVHNAITISINITSNTKSRYTID